MNITENVDVINGYIDQCNNNLTHYDISLIVHIVFKKYYRYIGDKSWEYYDIRNGIWKHDVKSQNMRNDINSVISDLFSTRSLHWLRISEQCSDINLSIHAKYLSEKMLNTSLKLKNNAFISVVIKEARSFFDIHTND